MTSKAFTQIKKLTKDNDMFQQLTLGEVVDTNDPQQMGRIRVACPYFGDGEGTVIEDIPWASPISPLAGTNDSASRGRGDDKTVGPVAYGMCNVPKAGAYVLIACLEGDPKFRVYLGGLHDQFLMHTLPHGRYTYRKAGAIKDEPSGPLSSTEDPIQPLYDSQTETFTKPTTSAGAPTAQAAPEPRKSFEYRSRGADQGVSGVENEFINVDDIIFSSKPDDIEESFTEADGNEIKNTFGYNKSRVQEGLLSGLTEFVYDPQVYSWTTPGFHSISMSDNSSNCRFRIRTTHGHQIILDDTNERIYISTPGGKTWIELDEKGNIDIYGERNISVHAEKDINFTAGDTFRVKAKNGIHLISEGEMRLHAKAGNLHLKSGGKTEINSIGNISMSTSNLFLSAQTDIHIKASGGVLNLQSGTATSIGAGSVLNLEAGADANILASGNILQTASAIHLNGPSAGSAAAATGTVPANTLEAYWTDRVPEHEPWARTMTDPGKTDKDTNNTHNQASEFEYDSTNVGRKERGVDLTRNPKWHR